MNKWEEFGEVGRGVEFHESEDGYVSKNEELSEEKSEGRG